MKNDEDILELQDHIDSLTPRSMVSDILKRQNQNSSSHSALVFPRPSSIPSFQPIASPSQSSEDFQNIKITYDMVFNIRCDSLLPSVSNSDNNSVMYDPDWLKEMVDISNTITSDNKVNKQLETIESVDTDRVPEVVENINPSDGNNVPKTKVDMSSQEDVAKNTVDKVEGPETEAEEVPEVELETFPQENILSETEAEKASQIDGDKSTEVNIAETDRNPEADLETMSEKDTKEIAMADDTLLSEVAENSAERQEAGMHLKSVKDTNTKFAYDWHSPQLMILFKDGDIDCALHFLVKSLHNPFAKNVVATILVEECLVEEFEKRVISKMHALPEDVASYENYLKTRRKLNELQIKMLVADKEQVGPDATPILACNCTQNMLGTQPTGVITMQVFRSIEEAMKLSLKEENLRFDTISIWNESMLGCYELAEAINCATFFFNCSNIDLSPILPFTALRVNSVRVVKNFHYEHLIIDDWPKLIVFPVETLLDAKKFEISPVEESPIDFLNS